MKPTKNPVWVKPDGTKAGRMMAERLAALKTKQARKILGTANSGACEIFRRNGKMALRKKKKYKVTRGRKMYADNFDIRGVDIRSINQALGIDHVLNRDEP